MKNRVEDRTPLHLPLCRCHLNLPTDGSLLMQGPFSDRSLLRAPRQWVPTLGVWTGPGGTNLHPSGAVSVSVSVSVSASRKRHTGAAAVSVSVSVSVSATETETETGSVHKYRTRGPILPPFL